jgi:NTE family protein
MTRPEVEPVMDEAWWRDLSVRVPVLPDRSLVRLVNSLNVVEDLGTSRSDRFFARVLGQLAGRDVARSRLVEAHLAGAQATTVEWIENLTRSATVSNLALVQTQRHLMTIKDSVERQDERLAGLLARVDTLIETTGSRIAHLEDRVRRVEAAIDLERMVNAWRAGETYRGLPWLVAVTLLCCDAADRIIAPREGAVGREPELRNDLVNRLCIVLPTERPWFPLAPLLGAAAGAIRPEDRDLLLALADDNSPLGQRRRQSPYLFAVWSAVVTAARRGPDLDVGAAAIARCRNHVAPIALAADLRWLMTQLVDEAADTAGTVRARLAQQIEAISGTSSVARAQAARPRPVPRPDDALPARPARAPFPPSATRPVTPRLGLVLSGGGARGGYEVGVVEYLAEAGFEPSVLAGASIGALNGAVISAAGDLASGAAALRAVWQEVCVDPEQPAGQIAEPEPGSPSPDTGSGIDPPQAGRFDRLKALMAAAAGSPVLGQLDGIVRKWAPLPELRRGTELWVTVFAAFQGGPPGLGWLVDLASGRLGAAADWVCVQHAGDHAQDLVLASAAIPGAFPPRKVNALPFRDGGIGNNLPVEPLVQRGCTHAIVVHLSQQSLWDANQFPALSVIEIRPRRPLAADGKLGWLESLVDFSPGNFDLRRRQGYHDARYWIERAMKADRVIHEHLDSIEMLTATSADLGMPA